MGGRKSSHFENYAKQCTQAFIEVRNHSESIIPLMEIMVYNSSFPAFKYNSAAIRDFRARLLLNIPDGDLQKAVRKLIDRLFTLIFLYVYVNI
jgi:hypothetical protein